MAEEQNPDAEGMGEDLADEWAAAMSESGDAGGEGDIDDEWAAAMSEQEVKPVKLEELATPSVAGADWIACVSGPSVSGADWITSAPGASVSGAD